VGRGHPGRAPGPPPTPKALRRLAVQVDAWRTTVEQLLVEHFDVLDVEPGAPTMSL
jgi:hypothetical protein